MKPVCTLLIFLLAFTPKSLHAQLFKLEAGLGTSHYAWHESEFTGDLSVQLSIQKKTSTRKFFVALKALGNIENAGVNRKTYEFVQPQNSYSEVIGPEDELLASYRGGEAEVGFMWNQKTSTKPHVYPILSLYSKSLARRIQSQKRTYLEEEKYALHGFTAGIGLRIPGKTEKLIQIQAFGPIIHNVTLFGAYVGIPYESLVSEKLLSYKGKCSLRHQKFGFHLSYERLNLGSANNKSSKSILVSQANSLSGAISYEF
jgi:hypothetical protein